MDIRPYPKGQPGKNARKLFKMGLLRKYPEQVDRSDLLTDEGVDIVYHLKGVTPSVFKEVADILLAAALEEGTRYEDEKYKFAKIVVEMDLNSKGKQEDVSNVREYIASKNPDTDTMVYGTGVDLPEGVRNPFLIGRVDEIIDILKTDSPGPYLKRKTPYKVTTLVISIRSGRSEHRKQIIEEMKKAMAPKMEEVRKAAEKKREENE